MSDLTGFARSLAKALGPHYGVGLASPEGDMETFYGNEHGKEIARLCLPMTANITLLLFRANADNETEEFTTAQAFSLLHLDDALEELISIAEAQMGVSIRDMTRTQKRQLVRLLDERGAFALRKSVESVADLLGVSRITIYNYLDWVRSPDTPSSANSDEPQ